MQQRHQNVSSEPDDLARLIAAAIMDRGFYVMLDEQIDLICAPACAENPNDPSDARMVRKFAQKHGWSVGFEGRWYTFTRD
jgi:hypothetical protein